MLEEGNLEVGRSDARVLVGPNILGALKHLLKYSSSQSIILIKKPRHPTSKTLKTQGQISTLGGETRVGVGIP